jgi:alpha-tubulin suppressor-like RCC1 family protein
MNRILKRMLVLKRGPYMRKVTVVLVMVALFVGTAGRCNNMCPDGDFYLCISSTLGGVVTKPGESCPCYYANTTVELIAEADEHHHFVNWTGDVDTIDDVNDASTNITMNDSYSITANFELDPGCHSLTIFNNYGGSVVEPGEGYFAYVASTTIDLIAEPGEDYRFKEWTGDVDIIANVDAAATNITMNDNYSITANFEWFDIIQVDACGDHTVGLKNDGTVVAVGYNGWRQCEVGGWTDIIQVAAGDSHTVGLKANGTVLAVGRNDSGQCNVGNWTGITQVAAGLSHTVGLKTDGTVVAVGEELVDDRCDVGNWTDIIQIAAGIYHTLGLKSDGTVVAVGCDKEFDDFGQCDVGSWTDIIQIAAGRYYTVGLKFDGTVVAVGNSGYDLRNVGSWTDIIQVSAGHFHTVGLKSDGTVVAVGEELVDDRCDVGSWTDIIQVAAGMEHTLGLKNDGTVVAVGFCGCGECNVGGWFDTWS